MEPLDPRKTIVMFSIHGGIFFHPRVTGDPLIVRIFDVRNWRAHLNPTREFRRVYAFCDELPFYMEQ